MRTDLPVLPLTYSAQAVRVLGQTGWWSHAFVPGQIEEGIPRRESPAPRMGSQLFSPGRHGARC